MPTSHCQQFLEAQIKGREVVERVCTGSRSHLVQSFDCSFAFSKFLFSLLPHADVAGNADNFLDFAGLGIADRAAGGFKPNVFPVFAADAVADGVSNWEGQDFPVGFGNGF